MANLLSAQVKELIKAPPHQEVLKKCIRHEERLKLHVEPVLNKKDANKANDRLLQSVKDFLPSEKYTRFEQLYQYPLPTNEITDSIFSELKRAINGEGSSTTIKLAAETQEQQFRDYLKENKHDNFWKNEAWEAFKCSIHSVLIIDQPSEQVVPPKPYCYLLDIKQVIDMDVKSNDAPCEYIIFRDSVNNDFVYAFDDTFYRTFKKEENSEYVLISEVPHEIGYCPAKPFWNTNLNSCDNIQKLGAITKSLAQLDRIVFWEISIEYYNTYGVFPVIWAYEQATNEENEEGSDMLDLETMGGIDLPLEHYHPAYQAEVMGATNTWRESKGKKLLGSGSFWTIPAPADNQDADLRDPFGYLQIQVDSLTFASDYLQDRKDMVFTYCVGRGKEPKNDQAKNEKQIQSAFESTTNILNWIADNFEISEQWVIKTKAIIIFGREAVETIEVKRGRKYYLKTARELTEEYKEEKGAGLPMYIISETRKSIAETKYKNNQEMIMRMKILSDLEPYADLSNDEIMKLGQLLNPQLVRLKLNFNHYIRRFEREELNLVRFGSLTSYSQKIILLTKH